MGLRIILMVGALVLLAACGGGAADPAEAVAALPEGDPARGEELYNRGIDGAPSCISCHAVSDQRGVGPGLAGYGQRAGSVVPEQSAEVYTYNAIVNPAAYIVSGYGNVMYSEYRSRLDDQQLADLIAYLLTL